MERADSSQKLYTSMRLWEFPDQYVVEPTDGSSGSFLAISRNDGSMNLIGGMILLAVLFYNIYVLLVLYCIVGLLEYLVLHHSSFFLFCAADELPECNSVRVPRILTIFGVVGMLKLLAGKSLVKQLKTIFFHV